MFHVCDSYDPFQTTVFCNDVGAQWEKAAELFEQMQSKGCKPDSVTYGGLILAYEKGGQWRQALAAFDQMKNNNCRPDSVVYNTVVGVLWNTGVVWAQAKAVQVLCYCLAACLQSACWYW